MTGRGRGPVLDDRRWRLWLDGARPRTLGASLAPVVVGTALAGSEQGLVWWRAAAAAVVAVALQVGTNYANDYSDGVRGTDAHRKGPVRLTASGAASPPAVRRAAALAFAVAAGAGLSLAIAVDLRLLVVGALAVGAGVLYTGGPRPYGYAGLGEVVVLIFFGFVATCGSVYVQLERVPPAALPASSAVGLLACAILVTNNLRDLQTDAAAGKRTLAVRLGPVRTRALYVAGIGGAFASVAALALARPAAGLALAAAPLAWMPVRTVLGDDDPSSLVSALVATARLQLVFAALLAAGIWISG